MQSIQAIDTKAIALLALVSLVLSLAATGKVRIGLVQLPITPLGLLRGGVTCFVCSAACALMALWVRDLRDGPSVRALLESYWDAQGDDLKCNILYWAAHWEQENHGLLRAKGNWLRVGLVAAVIEVVFLVVWSAGS